MVSPPSAALARPLADPAGPTRAPWRFSHHLEILAASFASLVVEISYTRIISYKLFYYYVYLIIGLALLGVGAGGVAVSISKRIRGASTDTVIFWSFVSGAVITLLGYLVVAAVRIDTLTIWLYNGRSFENLALLFVLCLCVFASFVPMGVIAASLFSRRPESIGGLYFADLLGAGAACALVIYVIWALGAPAAVTLAVAVLGVAAAWVGARRSRLHVSAGTIVAAAALVLTIGSGLIPAQTLDASKTPVPPGTGVASHWGPVLRVDVAHAPGYPDILNLYHDGILGAGIYRWNGQIADLARYDFPHDPRSLPFRTMTRPPQKEAVIGAAGGHEVLASLYYGAQHVDAVELNPVTVNLVSHTFANFDGHLAQNPHVSYINADGRSYIARSHQKYNLIWYPAPDSYAAGNGALSSAYVLSESYLYTTNGIQTMLEHLAPNGMMVVQFGETDDVYDLRTARLAATVRQALANLGIHDPADHVLVASTKVNFLGFIPLSTMLIQRSPFSASQVAAFRAGVAAVPDTTILSVAGQSPTQNPVNSVIATPARSLGSFYAHFPYNIQPTTDNNPYFYHFARWGNVISNFLHPLNSVDRENAVGERVLFLLLLVSVAAALVFLLLPFAAIRDTWVAMPYKSVSAVFFAGVGFGFIFFEITLMQLLNLFLGFPTYSLTVTLMSLLVFTGIGALASQRIVNRGRALPILWAVLAGLFVFYLVGLVPMTNALLGLPLAARIFITLGVLAPLGVCFGMFMPIGLGEIAGLGDFPRQYVAWGWAVNGFASVVGSALATILAMAVGFDVVLWLGFGSYTLAIAAWQLLVVRAKSRSAVGGVASGAQ